MAAGIQALDDLLEAANLDAAFWFWHEGYVAKGMLELGYERVGEGWGWPVYSLDGVKSYSVVYPRHGHE